MRTQRTKTPSFEFHLLLEENNLNCTYVRKKFCGQVSTQNHGLNTTKRALFTCETDFSNVCPSRLTVKLVQPRPPESSFNSQAGLCQCLRCMSQDGCQQQPSVSSSCSDSPLGGIAAWKLKPNTLYSQVAFGHRRSQLRSGDNSFIV